MNNQRMKRLIALMDRMHKIEGEAREVADLLHELEAEEDAALEVMQESQRVDALVDMVESNVNAIRDAAGIMEDVAEEIDNAAISLGDNVHTYCE